MNESLSSQPTSSDDSTRVLAARWVVPVSSSPIHGGWIRLAGQRVVEIGKGELPTGAIDLGDVAILPGLVNAHTHLEFSDCQRPIGTPGVPLHDWIGQVIEARRDSTPESKQQAIAAGIAESVAAGTRLTGEITTPPCLYDVPASIELVSFAEVLGLQTQRGDERFQAAWEHQRSCDCAAWSPHAPYSTAWSLIESCVQAAVASASPIAMHVAESPAERELISSGTGPMSDVLRRLGVWKDGLFPWSNDPFGDLIRLLADAPHALLVHGNDFRRDEIDLIGQLPNVSVVVCPRTHAYFGYDKHPIAEMQQANVRVALGTDSRASNPDLNLWKEVQYLLNHRPDLDPAKVIGMGTVNGADALGRPDLGRIEIGSEPGLGAVKTTASNPTELYQDFAQHEFDPISSAKTKSFKKG